MLEQKRIKIRVFLISHRIEIDLHFEKAYCLYRLNKTQEALDILNAIAEPSEHDKELKAQVVRRLIRYFNMSFQVQNKINLNLKASLVKLFFSEWAKEEAINTYS